MGWGGLLDEFDELRSGKLSLETYAVSLSFWVSHDSLDNEGIRPKVVSELASYFFKERFSHASPPVPIWSLGDLAGKRKCGWLKESRGDEAAARKEGRNVLFQFVLGLDDAISAIDSLIEGGDLVIVDVEIEEEAMA